MAGGKECSGAYPDYLQTGYTGPQTLPGHHLHTAREPQIMISCVYLIGDSVRSF